MAHDSGYQVDSVSRRKFLLSSGAVGATALAGCSSDANDGGGGGGGDGNGSGNGNGSGDGGGDGSQNLSGDIRISGSSTVYPVAQEVTRLFQEENSDVSFNLTRDGSGGGFENVFIPGDSDLNNASRPIEEGELQRCRDNGFEPVEFFIAQDALTVVVNNEADFIDSISLEDLETIWSAESAPESWSDVNSDWPDEPFDLYGPASTSGTYDYFIEAVLGEDGQIRDDFEGTEEDNLIAQGVSGNEYAFGYLPFAYYTNNPDSVKALTLSEGGGDPVEPSLEGAQSGDYPLARPLFFYGNMNMIQEKEHLQAFLEFYINEGDEDYIADDIGYVPSSDEMVQNNLDALEQATAGEYEYSA
ncbi:phosphate ABC transporter substrate-binding protein PstS family protein [Halalkalicoccus subterraneus]|uniref:phosphate ABC transporter substrate-binding protein PstS family protein n=1 Tax=Halalkalicoccus subterraneus TaxID=2675002 RepID=UPI000EFA6614|nr:phosphate ABC transporter substrate-binding protein PstS family protein [Halalkalicoccus subterraneus]